MRHSSCKSQYINSGMQLQELNLHLYKTQFLIKVPFWGKDRHLISDWNLLHTAASSFFKATSDSCMKVMFKIFDNT